MVAMPVPSYILQFYRAPTVMAPIEMPALATLLGAPNMAISPAAMRHVLALMGKNRGLPSMTLLSKATLARVWLQLENAEATFSELAHIIGSDDSFVRPQHPEWAEVVFINTLHNNFRDIRVVVPEPCPPRGLQSHINKILLLREVEEPLVLFAARRLSTTFRQKPANLRFTAKFCVQNLAVAARSLPLVHLAGYIRLFANAVITSARMGRIIAACHFCGALAGDDIRHWGACPAIADIANSLLLRLGFTPALLILWTPCWGLSQ
jgi:hypothetical protein